MSRKRRPRRYADDEMDMDEDAIEGNPHARRRPKKSTFLKIPRWVYKILLILVVCVLGLLIWFNRDNLSPSNVVEWVQNTVVGMGVGDGFPSSITGGSVEIGNFGSSNQEAVVVSDTALTVLNSTAKQLVSRQHSFSKPIMCLRNSRVLIYNLGGTGYQIESHTKSIAKANTDQNILAGDIAANGRYALATQAKGYCSSLTTYLEDKTKQYRYDFSEYYVTGVALNKDGTKGAVCAASAKDGAMCSAVFLFDFSNPKPVATLTYSDNIMLSISYCDDGTIVAVGDNLTSVIQSSTMQKTDYSYQGQQFAAYAVDSGHTALALLPYRNSTECKLVVLDRTGKVAVSTNIKQKIKSVALLGDTVAALADNKVYAFSVASGNSMGTGDAGNDAKAIAMCNERSAYVLGVSEIRLTNIKQ